MQKGIDQISNPVPVGFILVIVLWKIPFYVSNVAGELKNTCHFQPFDVRHLHYLDFRAFDK